MHRVCFFVCLCVCVSFVTGAECFGAVEELCRSAVLGAEGDVAGFQERVSDKINMCTIATLGAGAVVGVVAAPLVVSALGFTAGGIAGGSVASWMMSTAAVANGGGVVAGTLVAVMQSAGAAGLSAAGQAAAAATGVAVAAGLNWANMTCA